MDWIQEKPKISAFKLTLTLLLVCVIVAGALGAVDAVTRGTIADNKQKAYNEAQRHIFPDATFTALDGTAEGDIAEICLVTAAAGDGQLGDKLGYTVRVAPAGRNGPIDMLVGVDMAGKVVKVEVLSSSENADGAKTSQESFLTQYAGKSSGLALGDGQGNTIQGVTSGTISSRAVTAGVNTALQGIADLSRGEEIDNEPEMVASSVPTVNPTGGETP